MSKRIVIGIISFIILAGLIFVFTTSETVAPTGEGEPIATDDTPSTSSGTVLSNVSTSTNVIVGDSISRDDFTIIAENQPAGDRVILSRLMLPLRLWVVVYEDVEGERGSILGAGRFPAGHHTDMKIELLRSTVSNGTYHIVVHGNDSDDAFEWETDDLPLLVNGAEISTTFTAM